MAEINGMTQQEPTLGFEQIPALPQSSQSILAQRPHISSNTHVQESRLEIVEEPISTSGPQPAHELEPHEPQQAPGPEPVHDPIHALELEPTQQLIQGPELTQASGPDPAKAPGPESSQLADTLQQATGPVEQIAQNSALQQEQGPKHAVQLNLPIVFLLKDDKRKEFMDTCVPLYKASMSGDWNAALGILNINRNNDPEFPDLLRCSITHNCETMLHVAASAQNTNFVQKLVDKMEVEDLKYQNKSGNTALCLAAITGNVEITRIMVDRCQDLLTISNKAKMIPLYIAALYGKRDMVNYLYDETNRHNQWTEDDKKWVYVKCVEAELFVIALRIFQDHTELAKTQTKDVLGVLARKPSTLNKTRQHIMRRIFNSIICCCKVRPNAEIDEGIQLLRNILTSYRDTPVSAIDKILRGPPLIENNTRTYPSRVLFVAAEMGNTKFIVELIRQYPDLIWKTNDSDQSIFHIAVCHRRQSIYNLLYEIGSMKDLIVVLRDPDNNNMLHLVGKMVNKSRLQDVSGAAFQMQRELLWYKEVESMIPPSYRERKNIFGETPHELFTRTHKDLVANGEKWMRGTASKCMLVATLVATIVFGVAYTIPGGYKESNGFPVFLHNGPFIVFVIIDAISLILSATSILVFLSILTSRYTQEDFTESLPKKLIAGLSMLFLSIVTMMIAFSVSFFVLYREKFVILACFISIFALIPIISYAQLHYPLIVDVFRSTYGSRYLFKPKQRMLYYKNPRS